MLSSSNFEMRQPHNFQQNDILQNLMKFHFRKNVISTKREILGYGFFIILMKTPFLLNFEKPVFLENDET